jgi:Flp pilus assembly protein TadD
LRALELEPDQPNVLNYLAYSWIDKGVNLPRAKSMIEKAASQRPDDGAIIDSLGWMHYRMGDFHRAVETLENAITLMPQDAVINDHLGDAYWQVGRRLEAEFQWRRALTFDPDPDVRRSIEQKLQFGLSGAEQPAEPAGASAQKS